MDCGWRRKGPEIRPNTTLAGRDVFLSVAGAPDGGMVANTFNFSGTVPPASPIVAEAAVWPVQQTLRLLLISYQDYRMLLRVREQMTDFL